MHAHGGLLHHDQVLESYLIVHLNYGLLLYVTAVVMSSSKLDNNSVIHSARSSLPLEDQISNNCYQNCLQLL